MAKGWRFALAAAIPLRCDSDGPALRRLAKASDDADQTRRLLALSVIYDGGRRCAAGAVGGVGLQIIRDWVVRFNAEGPSGLIDRKAPGARPKLTADQRRALVALVDGGPIPAVHGVVRWRLRELAHWIFEEFGGVVSETTVRRTLKAAGVRRLSARPRHHAQNAFAREHFKKPSRPSWRRSGRALDALSR